VGKRISDVVIRQPPPSGTKQLFKIIIIFTFIFIEFMAELIISFISHCYNSSCGGLFGRLLWYSTSRFHTTM